MSWFIYVYDALLELLFCYSDARKWWLRVAVDQLSNYGVAGSISSCVLWLRLGNCVSKTTPRLFQLFVTDEPWNFHDETQSLILLRRQFCKVRFRSALPSEGTARYYFP